MKLYFSPGACSLSCHIALRESGLPFDAEKVDIRAHKTASGADYYGINPKGYVPALALDDGDGDVLTENAAILPYIADLAPEKNLAPKPGTIGRAHMQEWLSFIGSEIHRAFSPLFRSTTPEDVKQAQRETIAKRFAYTAEKLAGKQYLMGNDFSVADGYLYVMLTWAGNVGVDASAFKEYKERIEARPAVKAALEAEKAARAAS